MRGAIHLWYLVERGCRVRNIKANRSKTWKSWGNVPASRCMESLQTRTQRQNAAQSVQPVSFRNAMDEASTPLFCRNYGTSRADNRPVAAAPESLLAAGERVPSRSCASWKRKRFPYIRVSFFSPSGHILTSDLWQRWVSILVNIPSPKSATHKGCYYKPHKKQAGHFIRWLSLQMLFYRNCFHCFGKHICIHNY